MMKSNVEEKLVSFKTLEQKVFAYVCELGREIQLSKAWSKDIGSAGRDRI